MEPQLGNLVDAKLLGAPELLAVGRAFPNSLGVHCFRSLSFSRVC